MTRWLYSFAMWLAQALLRRQLAQRGAQEPGYLEAMEERFGHYTTPPLAPDGNTIWLHAVSLGETRAAAVLVAALRQHWPKMRLLLTHGTATGRAEGLQLLRPGDLQVWQPWDTPTNVQRFLHHFRPHIGILMETEIWPNLATLCQRAAVPLVLVNARLSEKSLRSAQRLAWLARPAYRALRAVWAQTQDDAARFAKLGVAVQGVLGNLKFDAKPDAEQVALGRTWRHRIARPVVMLASSRVGEELALLQILNSFRSQDPVDPAQAAIYSIANEVQWLIVPRHPQRFDAVAALIEAQGMRVARRSQWPDGPRTESGTNPGSRGASSATASDRPVPAPTIWLGDSLGEMALYYSLADLALLGGSFEPFGGQNLIEAAACGCPLLMGPHTFNFAEAAELAQASGAARRVGNLAAAVTQAVSLARNDAQLQVARQAALTFSRTHRGAAERLLQGIEQMLTQVGPAPR
jgi:3-deoxy-D-manno-octulosonic-acid transferase